MQFIAHRVNRLDKLALVPEGVGAEVDVRIGHTFGGKNLELIMSHDPWVEEMKYENFIASYVQDHQRDTLVINVKNTGIEQQLIDIAESYGVQNYFLLDVEPPYLYNATKQGVSQVAVRVSEYEPFEILDRFRGCADRARIDTATHLPLDAHAIELLQGYQTCLVCPERWGRTDDIVPYAEQMQQLGFMPDAIMTAIEHIDTWKQALGV